MYENSTSASKSNYYKDIKKHIYEVISKDEIKCIKCGKIIRNLQISKSRLKLRKSDLFTLYRNKKENSIIGIIYRISIKKDAKNNYLFFPGKSYIGLTTGSLIQEWNDHFSGAFNEKTLENRRNDHFSRALRRYSNNDKHLAKKLFKVKIWQVCYTQEELDNAEKFWIGFFKTQQDRYGFNTLEGGRINPPQLTGEESPFWKRIQLKKLDQAIKNSFKINFKDGPLNKIANDFNVDITTMIAKIAHFYKDKDGNCLKYMDLRFEKIKQELEPLIKKGWNASYIGEELGIRFNISPSNRPNIVNCWCKTIYKKTFSEVQAKFLKDVLESIVTRGLMQKEIITYDKINHELPGISKRTIVTKMNQFFGGLKPLLKDLRRPLVEVLIKENLFGEKICKLIGYSKSTSKTRSSIISRDLFWGLSVDQLKNFFNSEHYCIEYSDME